MPDIVFTITRKADGSVGIHGPIQEWHNENQKRVVAPPNGLVL